MTPANEFSRTDDNAPELSGCALLTDLGVIRAQGEDAAAFLHSQLTQDFALLGQGEARLAGFCNAKGRMQASFVGFKTSGTEVLLIVRRELLAQTLKRLSMFVLRAKVKLSDASADLAVWGCMGAAVSSTLPHTTWATAEQTHEAGTGHWVRLPAGAGVPRAYCCTAANTPAPVANALTLEQWNWGEVRSGVVLIGAAVYEAFVPQMLNYESVGGVNFKKGCYPGQEVVARSQFRGALKRRGYLLHADAEMVAGQEIYHPADPEQPCGIVAAVAPHPLHGWDAMASIQTASLDGQTLTLGAPDGTPLSLIPLPYELLQDI